MILRLTFQRSKIFEMLSTDISLGPTLVLVSVTITGTPIDVLRNIGLFTLLREKSFKLFH